MVLNNLTIENNNRDGIEIIKAKSQYNILRKVLSIKTMQNTVNSTQNTPKLVSQTLPIYNGKNIALAMVSVTSSTWYLE